MSSQTITDTILMVRPKNFGYNTETAENNAFQSSEGAENTEQIKVQALEEFDQMVSLLKDQDIEVIVVEDTDDPPKPDSIFPNNWFSTHASGNVITYPMHAHSRRPERREDIIDLLTKEFGYKKRYGFEYLEEDNQFLEGTGSMILDRDNHIIYACLSPRTDIKALEKFCVLMKYEKVIFHATDDNDQLIYHTNVMMGLGVNFVVICLDAIKDIEERNDVIEYLEETGKTIIEISLDQMNQFAGNMIQLRSKMGESFLIMSQTAFDSLDIDQIDAIHSHTKTLKFSIPTIEKYGGGSVRCMIAEVYPSLL